MPRFILREQPRNEIKSTWPLYEQVAVWIYHTIVPWIIYFFVTLLTSTYRWRQMVSKELLELMSTGKPFAVATWHSDMLLGQSLGKRLGWTGQFAVMVALNQAGEVETRILKRLGYNVVRGSEKKRGKEALEDMKDILNQGAIAGMVVDGPLGPAREVKAGVVELARFCQVPIVPITFMPGNEWILPTWDRTRIPKPFSRCVTVSSIPITVPPDLRESQFDAVRADIKAVLTDLEKQKIGWHQALSVNMKLIPLFGVRNSIVRIQEKARKLTPGRLAKDKGSLAYLLDELSMITAGLKQVKKRYYKNTELTKDWKQFCEMRTSIQRACRTRDPEEVFFVANEVIIELGRRIEDTIGRLPLFASEGAPGS
jgi:lysophospholipid acyltransferase (LPLAT)-like uncharacterized protein